VFPGNITVHWTCTENQACVLNPPLLGAIAQFWVNTTTANPAFSISGPNGEQFIQYTHISCPSEVVISNVTCANRLGSIPNPNTKVPAYNLLLAFDSTGLVQYSHQIFQPEGTDSGDVGGFIYTFQSMLPPQSDSTSIFWQDSTWQPMMWELTGTAVTPGPSLAKPSSGWYIAGIGDFNGDGNSDIFWRNGAANQIWELNETGRINKGQNSITDNYTGTILNPGSDWKVVGIGDFNRDGKSDILWQNDSSGSIEIWEMNGTTLIARGRFPKSDPVWQAVGTGDFNGDGMADILWQNPVSGAVTIWEMDGTSVINTYGAFNPGPSWQAVGVGDFDGAGKSDILFQYRNPSNLQDPTNGRVSILKRNGAALIPIRNANGSIPNPGAGWRIVGISDYHSDGTTDIVFQKDDGRVTVWGVNGTVIKYQGRISDPNPNLYVMGVGQ
jgi:FG-GAP-like repeat